MFQYRVFKLLEKQNHDIRSLTKEVESLKQIILDQRQLSVREENTSSDASAVLEPFNLPLATEEDVLQLEATIQDQQRFQALVCLVLFT